MKEEFLRALFLLAGVECLRLHEIANGYYRDPTAPPWWLVETPYGLIKIGWRKRVINIDWESTAIRSVVTEDDVTKCETMVHAWSYHKAVEYLNQFALLASRQLAASKS